MELSTFAEYLKNISLSIDIVNDSTITRIQPHCEKYFKKLNIQFFEFLTPYKVEGSEALKTQWHSGGEEWAQRIKNSEGKYNGQISYAYDKVKKLCVVAKDRLHLSKKDNTYFNLWNAKEAPLKNLPPFVNLSDTPIYASIMIPILAENGRKLGIFNFEFGENFEYTLELQKELETLTSAFGTLLVLNRAYRTQRDNTNKAILALGHLENFPSSFVKPRVFVASSKKADPDVIQSIDKVLHEFRSQVKIVNWYEIDKSGNIGVQILEAISNCSYGVCYFSERLDEESEEFNDNANVLFEAGMIHGLSRIALKGPKNWIPIRESNEYAGDLPFDLATERILHVPRENKIFDKKGFEMELRQKFKNLLVGK